MTHRNLQSLNRRIDIVAEHINGANSLAIGRSFKVSDKYVRVVIAKNIKIPRILDAATLRAAAMARAGSGVMERFD